MKTNLLGEVGQLLQEESDRVCKLFRQPFELEIGEVRSDEGYFKAGVWVRPTRGESLSEAPLELVRSLVSMIEQRVEEQHQGLRIMLLPQVKKSPSVRRRKAG